MEQGRSVTGPHQIHCFALTYRPGRCRPGSCRWEPTPCDEPAGHAAGRCARPWGSREHDEQVVRLEPVPGLTCTWAIFPSTVLLTTVSIFTTAPGIGEPR